MQTDQIRPKVSLGRPAQTQKALRRRRRHHRRPSSVPPVGVDRSQHLLGVVFLNTRQPTRRRLMFVGACVCRKSAVLRRWRVPVPLRHGAMKGETELYFSNKNLPLSSRACPVI